MKNYYATLGVTPQAEDVVIKAAYRALAQRYHPDKYSGSVEESHLKMAEINEAYETLSDPVKRAAYDSECTSDGMGNDQFDAGDEAANEGVKQFDQDWETALEYYPDLASLEMALTKVSQSLAFTFRLYMITEKAFKSRKQVAHEMQEAFLIRYFGSQVAIRDFAKTLISLGQKDATKALNQAVSVLGDDLDPILVINKIKGRFGLFPVRQHQKNSSSHSGNSGKSNSMHPVEENSRAARLARSAAKAEATFDEVRNAIDELGGSFRVEDGGCSIDIFGESFQSLERSAAVTWFREVLYPRLLFS